VVQAELAQWMRGRCLSDAVWWSLNPGDEGLLQEDWVTLVEAKWALLETVQPRPSRLSVRGKMVCLEDRGGPGEPGRP
jgi:hypothetical protein